MRCAVFVVLAACSFDHRSIVMLTFACNAGATCIYHCCGGNACNNFTCIGTGCVEGVPACF